MKVIHTADWHLGKILNGKQFFRRSTLYIEQTY